MTQGAPGVLIAGLQRRLLVLLMLVLLPVYAFFVIASFKDQQQAVAKASESLQAASRMAALGAERHVEGTRQLLNAISSAPSLKNSGLNNLCREFLANIRNAYPYYTNLAFLTPQGEVVCDALNTDASTSFKDRSYFVEALDNGTFSMGVRQVGQITGVASMGFALPVYSPENPLKSQLKGVAYAAVEIGQLALALKSPLPQDVSVTLTDRQGTILGVDAGQRSARPGTRMADDVLQRALKVLPGGAVASTDPEGAARLYAVTAVLDDTGPGMFVVASQALHTVTAPARSALLTQLVWITLVALLGILLARGIAQRTLVKPARLLVKKINLMGNDSDVELPEQASSADDIGSLSSAFDRLAGLLTARHAEQDRHRQQLEKVQASLLMAQRIAKIGNWELDAPTQMLWWSAQTCEIFGLASRPLKLSLAESAVHVFPEDRGRCEAAYQAFLSGTEPLNLRYRVVTGGAKIRWVQALGEMQKQASGQPLTGSGTVQDITERVVNESLLATEARAMKALSLNMPLQAVLEEVLLGLESILPGASCSVMLISPDGLHMQRGAAPHLPAELTEAAIGVPMGPAVGSCGTAAFLRQTVVVDDIAQSPLWVDFRDLYMAHGYRACWSIPVLDASGAVIATFAAYYKHTHQPQAEELALAHSAASVIGVAVERELRELALRTSNQRFRKSFQEAATGMLIANLDGQFVEVNSAYCTMLGYSSRDLYAMNVEDVTHPKDWPQNKLYLEELAAGRANSFVFEKRCIHRSGSVVWLRVSVSLLRSTTDQAEGFIGISEDITRQRQALEQLRLLETAVSRLNDIVLITEAEPTTAAGPRIVFVNNAFERQTGYRREEVIGQTPHVLQGLDTAPGELARMRLAISQWLPVRTELIHDNKQGQPFWVELDIVPIADDTGQFTHWVAVGRDITQRKRAQMEALELNAELENRVQQRTAQLKAVNRELEAFSYSVSHDLRSPLNTVNGFAQLLQKSHAASLNDKGQHYLNRIRAGTQQMGELIEGLLSLAKLSRNALRISAVDLSAIALRVEQECREREPERPVTLHIQPELSARGDATLLLLVMQNLLSNAWKYTSKQTDARIDVGAQPTAGGETAYFVRDNGAGFDMAHADKLFSAFQRLHAPSDFAGTGVGLANVKRVIERHGGRVWAEGHLNEGATFFFTIDCPAA